jgi:iron complex transport system ATP-binding protein
MTNESQQSVPRTHRLEGKGLTLAYDDKVVVPELDIELPVGKITSIVGPNGCGKSTTLRALSRLLKPKAGTVLLDGEEIRTLPTKEVARRLAILPQGPTPPAGLTVERLVWHGRYPHQGTLGSTSPADAEAVRWALEQTEMYTFAERPLDSLSGGERQRAWVAMALAQQTPILLLDEPTTFLDLGHQLEVLELLSKLNHQMGITIVMVLHELNQAARYSDYLIALRDGEMWTQGTPEEVLTRELLSEVFGVNADVVMEEVSGRP